MQRLGPPGWRRAHAGGGATSGGREWGAGGRHTGRPLQAAPAIALACVAINAATAVRARGGAALPAWHLQSVVVAGLLWMAAFALFTAVYAPYLVRARLDGQAC